LNRAGGGKYNLWDSASGMERMNQRLSTLEENIRTVTFTTGGSQRLLISNLPNERRVEQFCEYLLENYIDADSASLVLMFCIVIQEH
jgi:hypothetical protein